MGKLVSQRQIYAQIALTDGQTTIVTLNKDTFKDVKFTQVSGGEITAGVEKVYRGGERFPEVLCAPAEIGDITVTNPYPMKGETDMAVELGAIANLRQLVGRAYFDITVKVTDCGISVVGNDRFYPKCLLVGLTEPDGDASSGTPATYAMTFSVSTVAEPTAS